MLCLEKAPQSLSNLDGTAYTADDEQLIYAIETSSIENYFGYIPLPQCNLPRARRIHERERSADAATNESI